MGVVGVVIVNSFLEQVAQTALAEPVEVARRQITPELINCDLENKPGLLKRGGRCDRGRILRMSRRECKD